MTIFGKPQELTIQGGERKKISIIKSSGISP